MSELRYAFSSPLVEGLIKSRPNRFIMTVDVEGKTQPCHCPSTGRIGSLQFKDIPCLCSKSDDPGRKAKYTVEAFSLDPPGGESKSWIGINQAKANDYVEFFLRSGQMSGLFDSITSLKREVPLANSRVDFLVNGRDYLEVKTPLKDIPCEGHPCYKKSRAKFLAFDRVIKHFCDVSNSVEEGSRAIFLMCYMYDGPPFEVPAPEVREQRIVDAAKKATMKGLENWQADLKIDAEGVSLISYFKLDLF